MRSTTRYLALALVSVWLAGCNHHKGDPALAYVPADTPYVLTNLRPLSSDTRAALLARADAELPAQLDYLRSALPGLDTHSAEQARLLQALTQQVQGKSIERFSDEIGLDPKGRMALYGQGLAPVLRLPLRDSDAFQRFLEQLGKAYGTPIPDTVLDGQSYRHIDLGSSQTQLLIALRHEQAIIAILPRSASAALTREVLGLSLPEHSLLDSKALKRLAKDRGYDTEILARVDMHRLLGLLGEGRDPLLKALLTAQATPESQQTGEPVERLISIPASCKDDAQRIADRIPQLSVGYTRLDAKHQDTRWDIDLADDITAPFSGLRNELPGLGSTSDVPFDLQAALPISELRGVLQKQVDAINAKPFTCPTVADVNTLAKRLAILIQQLGVPPIGQLRGLRLSLDRFDIQQPGLAGLSGRSIIASQAPDSLIATAQLFLPSISDLRIQTDSQPQPQPLPDALLAPLGQPGWVAANSKAVAIGIGAGEGSQIATDLAASTGKDPILGAIHLRGDMYRNWVEMAAQRAEQSREAMPDTAQANPTSLPASALAASSRAQMASMRAQAERVDHFDAHWWIGEHGIVISNQVSLH